MLIINRKSFEIQKISLNLEKGFIFNKTREKKIIIRKYRIKRLLFSLAIRNLKLLLKHEIKLIIIFKEYF